MYTEGGFLGQDSIVHVGLPSEPNWLKDKRRSTGSATRDCVSETTNKESCACVLDSVRGAAPCPVAVPKKVTHRDSLVVGPRPHVRVANGPCTIVRIRYATMDACDRQSYLQQAKNHVPMHAHMYDIHATHMYVIPACMYVAAPWNEVKGAR